MNRSVHSAMVDWGFSVLHSFLGRGVQESSDEHCFFHVILCVYICIHVCVSLCLFERAYASMCMCAHVCLRMCACGCVWVWTCVHAHVNLPVSLTHECGTGFALFCFPEQRGNLQFSPRVWWVIRMNFLPAEGSGTHTLTSSHLGFSSAAKQHVQMSHRRARVADRSARKAIS